MREIFDQFCGGSVARKRLLRQCVCALVLATGAGAVMAQTAPSFTSVPVTSATEDELYLYAVTAADPDLGDTLVFSASALPGWLTLADNGDGTATLTGTPEDDEIGDHSVMLTVEDTTALSATQAFTITVGADAEPPVFTTTPITSVTEGERYNYAIGTDDPDGDDDELDVTAPVLPDWLTLHDRGGPVLEGTPGPGDVGTHTVELLATDPDGLTATQSFVVTVVGVNEPPAFTSEPVTAVDENATYTYSVTATDPDAGDALTLTAAILPAWLTLTDMGDGTATLAGTPGTDEIGNHNVELVVTDSGGLDASQTFTITVSGVNEPPAFTSEPVTVVGESNLYSYAIAAIDPDAGDTLAITAPTLPSWLVLSDNGDGTASLQGTPSQEDVGTHAVELEVTDAEASTVQSFSITVTDVNAPPSFTSTPPTSAEEDTPYQALLEASDPDGDPLTFEATSLPSWLSLADNGNGTATLSGEPTLADVGLANVEISVVDDEGLSDRLAFELSVNAVDDPPVVGAIEDQTASENVPFDLALAQFVDDEESPDGLTYAVTGLPQGLAFDASTGRIDGVPTLNASAGDYTVDFTVSDGVNPPIGASFRLVVLQADRVDLALSVVVEPNPVGINATATWRFTIENSAPLTAASSGARLEARFSGDVPLTFGAAPGGCTLTTSGATELACTTGPIAGGAGTSFALTSSASRAGDVFVSAEIAVVGDNPIDEMPGNDSATLALSVAQNVTEQAAQVLTDVIATALAAGDLDGDGHADLVVGTSAGRTVEVYRSIVDPDAPAKRRLSDSPIRLGTAGLDHDVTVADLDGDGDLDVAAAHASGRTSTVYENAGDATFAAVALITAGSRAVAAGDVDGDGLMDLVLANAGLVAIHLGTGAGVEPAASSTLDAGDAVDVVLADLAGADGLPELVVANRDGDAAVYANNGGVLASAPTLRLATSATTSVAARDLNGDTQIDLVFGRETSVNGGAPSNLVLLNASGATLAFSSASDRLGVSPTASVLTEDTDLDGDADLVFVNRNGVHQIYTNSANASAIFALHPEQLATEGASAGLAASLGTDERVDLAIAGPASVSIFYNDGAGNFGRGDATAPVLTLNGPSRVELDAGDAYVDAGATATDETDGDVTGRIEVNNPVDTSVIGSYAVTYEVTDSSGNAALPLTRTVVVGAEQNAGGGGGGGAFGIWTLLALMAALAGRKRRQARSGRAQKARPERAWYLFSAARSRAYSDRAAGT